MPYTNVNPNYIFFCQMPTILANKAVDIFFLCSPALFSE